MLSLEQETRIREKSPQTERGEETPQDLSDGRFRRHRKRRERDLCGLHVRTELSAVQQIHGRFQKGRGHRHAHAGPRLFRGRRQGTRGRRVALPVRPDGTAFRANRHPPECPGKLISRWVVTDEQRIRQRMIYVRHYFPGVNLDTISDEEFAMLSEERCGCTSRCSSAACPFRCHCRRGLPDLPP